MVSGEQRNMSEGINTELIHIYLNLCIQCVLRILAISMAQKNNICWSVKRHSYTGSHWSVVWWVCKKNTNILMLIGHGKLVHLSCLDVKFHFMIFFGITWGFISDEICKYCKSNVSINFWFIICINTVSLSLPFQLQHHQFITSYTRHLTDHLILDTKLGVFEAQHVFVYSSSVST